MDILNSCRACMTTQFDNMKSLCLESFKEMFTACTGLPVSVHDLLPQKLCEHCAESLRSLDLFRLQCHESTLAFYSLLDKGKVEKIDVTENMLGSHFLNSHVAGDIKSQHSQIIDFETEHVSCVENDEDDDSAEDSKQNILDEKDSDVSVTSDHNLQSEYSKTGKTRCEICKKTFVYNGAFSKHQLVCRKNKLSKKFAKQKKSVILISSYKCGLCDSEFKKIENLNLHLGKHRKQEDLNCGLCDFKGIDWAHFYCHRYLHQPAVTMGCCACPKKFSNRDRLEFHIRGEHLLKKPGLCHVCHKQFMNMGNWREHEVMHTGAKPRECQVCGKSFIYRTSLLLHMKCHTDVKKYVCQICGIAFRFYTGLTSHQFRRHTDLDPVVCSHCGKTFKNTETLREHMLRTNGVRNVPCDVCGQTFRSDGELQRHAKCHSTEKPFGCDHCGKAYKTRSHLVNHMRLHTGERPYKCGVCKSSFMTSSVLRRHCMIHSGERPHCCQICGKTFVEKCKLKKHLITH